MIKFPEIYSIHQVREAIRGRDEFFEAEREIVTGLGTFKYHVFNYLVGHTDSFDDPIRRECRGLIFDANGNVLSRRFHKFFNLGEKEETFFDRIDWSLPHTLQHKMDGSMITPLVLHRGKSYSDNVIRWATKMGVTDIGNMVFNFTNEDQRYNVLAVNCYDQHVTPIFEYVSPFNRIVVPYGTENLILLAVRHNATGEYFTYHDLKKLAAVYGVPVVDEHPAITIDDLRTKTDIEGVVVTFDCGMKVKIKTEWYCAIHRAKENLLHEKSVLKLILEEKMDDVYPFLLDYDKKRVDEYSKAVLDKIEKTTVYINELHDGFHDHQINRKAFALVYAPRMPKFLVSIVFATWGKLKSEIRKEVIKTYLKNTSCQSDVDSIREFIGTTWISDNV